MKSCLVCRAHTARVLLDLGRQPVATHFLKGPAGDAPTAPLALAVCESCGIVQQALPFPHDMLVPPYEWLNFREPEDHLDAVVDRIVELSGKDRPKTVAGISSKDRTTLDRCRDRGMAQTWILDPEQDLGAATSRAGVETVQALLDPDRAEAAAARRGGADVLIARHIAEHAGDPRTFLASLERLLAPGGLMVLEIPDSERNLDLCDYTMIWEEHTLFLTEQTFPHLLSDFGCQVLDIERHPYPFEDVLVLYARRGGARGDGAIQPRQTPDQAVVAGALRAAARYAEAFAPTTAALHKRLGDLSRKGPLALYGAGHLTNSFLNFHDLAGYFAFVVDDTPDKQGLLMPGSGLEIVPRERLRQSDVTMCLFGLAPEIEDKVIANNQDFVSRGGAFGSILVASKRTVLAA